MATACASSTPPDIAADPFARLPPELLTYICIFFPLRRRLALLCRLSKRWCACARRSVTSMAGYQLTPAIARLLPCLAEVHLYSPPFPVAALPTTVRSLTLASPTALLLDAYHIPHLTHLTMGPLGVDEDDPPPADAWSSFIAGFFPRHYSTLESLKLRAISTQELTDVVRHFPRLTSLHLRPFPSSRTAFVACLNLVALNSEHLTSLDLATASFADASKPPALRPLPRLRRLTFDGDGSWLRLLLPHLPDTLFLNWSTERLYTDLSCDMITSFTCRKPPANPELLARCTRLHTLDLQVTLRPEGYALFAPPSSVVRLHLTAPPPAEWFAPLRKVTYILVRSNALGFVPPRALASLRELYIDWRPYSAGPRGLAALCDVIAACPRLHTFGCSTPPHVGQVVLSEVAQLARFAEAQGVRSLDLQIRVEAYDNASDKLQRLNQLSRSFTTLCLTVTPLGRGE